MTNPGRKRLPLKGSLVVLGVSLGLLSTWVIGPVAGTAAKLENRAPAKFPQITWQSLADSGTYAAIEAWAKDNIRLKPEVVSAFNSILESQVVTDVVSSESVTLNSRVVVGGRWSADRPRELFGASEFVDRCWQRPSYSEFSRVLQRIQDAATASGKDVTFIITPSKHRVMGALLGSRESELTVCANTEDRIIIKPRRVLHYAWRAPYWPGDIHWTPKAGLALSEQLLMRGTGLTRLHAEKLLRKRLAFTHVKALGGLYAMQGNAKTTSEPAPIEKYPWIARFKSPANHKVAAIDAGGVKAPATYSWRSSHAVHTATSSMLIIHDSFVNMPALTKQFASMFPRGIDVHWGHISDLAVLPPVKTVFIENLDRTFLHRLAADAGAQDLAGQGDTITPVIDYLMKLPKS